MLVSKMVGIDVKKFSQSVTDLGPHILIQISAIARLYIALYSFINYYVVS